MPFTPFHSGPGVLLKAVAPKRFNLTYYLAVQVIIDTETARNIHEGNLRLHTFFHTFIGSLVAGAIAIGVVKLGSLLLARIFYGVPFIKSYFDGLLGEKPSVIAVTVLIGCWLHIILDSIMHSDIWPFWPLSKANPLNEILSVETLHFLLVITLILGLVIFWFKSFRRVLSD